MMAYIYVLLSAACSLAIAHFLKFTESRGLRTLNTLTFNYLVAVVFAGVVGLLQSPQTLHMPSMTLWVFCGLVGAFFILNFLLYSKSIHANGVGVTITFMRLSLLVPVLISILLYDEYLGTVKTGGVLLVFAALVLLVPKQRDIRFGRIDAAWLLLFIFLLSGFTDASLKVYEEEFSIALGETFFMALVFLSAFIIGLGICLIRKGPLFRKDEIKFGSLIGIPNLYSAIFLIYALGDIDGSIAYPLVNILIVAGGAIIGLAYWKDQITHLQWLGLVLAMGALLILF